MKSALTVSFSLLLLSYCYPDWINGTITYFPNTCILTCPLLLSFLLLFFLLAHCFFFSCHFIHTATQMNCYLFSCFFFSHLSAVTFFPITFFPTCPLLLSFLLLFSCYFFSYLKLLLSFLLPFFLLLSFRAPTRIPPKIRVEVNCNYYVHPNMTDI